MPMSKDRKKITMNALLNHKAHGSEPTEFCCTLAHGTQCNGHHIDYRIRCLIAGRFCGMCADLGKALYLFWRRCCFFAFVIFILTFGWDYVTLITISILQFILT